MEKCTGCNAKAERHPIVAVMHISDVRARADVLSASGAVGARVNPRGFVAAPVCDDCHQDPAHRTYPLKATFFEREHATVALVMAGSSSGVGL